MLLFWFVILSTAVAELGVRQSVFQGKNLRILPLGASITWGEGSSNGNGYRDDLRNLLSPAQVTFVGSRCSGTMRNGNNEGHPGYRIAQMQAVTAPDIALQPNVVLLYVGTNDMVDSQVTGVQQRIQQLVSYLTASLPSALIVVSKLFLDANSLIEARINTFNSGLDVTQLGNVMVADMSNIITVADLGSDGEHPNDSGYAKMAQVFAGVLGQAVGAGRIADPVPIQYTPMCNGPPVVAITTATTSATSTEISLTSSLSSSTEISSAPSPVSTTLSTISDPAASPSASDTNPGQPNSSAGQESTTLSAVISTSSTSTASSGSSSTGPVTSQTSTHANSAQRAISNPREAVPVLLFVIWLSLRS